MKKIFKLILAFILISTLCVAFVFMGIFNKPTETGKANTTIPYTTMSATMPDKELFHIDRTTGPIFINATVTKNSSTIPVYRGVLGNNDSINLQLQQIGKDRKNVTTPQEAPEVAKRVMEPYGGLPSDAVYNGASTTYTEFFNRGVLVSKEPSSTTVFYSRTINGLGVIGDSNSIILELGEDGELLWIFKVWRSYTYAGDVPLITLDTAIDKLEREELVESSWHPEAGDITIDLISPGYYAKQVGNSETILEPLWMFYGGNTTTGTRLGFNVYARKFANFTATPTTTARSEEITFRDISDASPTRRFWNFGDGTNSTLRNPTHAYEKPGNYTVFLTVWNDLGSDTLTKNDYIFIQRNKASDLDSVGINPTNGSDNFVRNQQGAWK